MAHNDLAAQFGKISTAAKEADEKIRAAGQGAARRSKRMRPGHETRHHKPLITSKTGLKPPTTRRPSIGRM